MSQAAWLLLCCLMSCATHHIIASPLSATNLHTSQHKIDDILSSIETASKAVGEKIALETQGTLETENEMLHSILVQTEQCGRRSSGEKRNSTGLEQDLASVGKSVLNLLKLQVITEDKQIDLVHVMSNITEVLHQITLYQLQSEMCHATASIVGGDELASSTTYAVDSSRTQLASFDTKSTEQLALRDMLDTSLVSLMTELKTYNYHQSVSDKWAVSQNMSPCPKGHKELSDLQDQLTVLQDTKTVAEQTVIQAQALMDTEQQELQRQQTKVWIDMTHSDGTGTTTTTPTSITTQSTTTSSTLILAQQEVKASLDRLAMLLQTSRVDRVNVLERSAKTNPAALQFM
eukprot:c282_g1_i1.p1 GENE.c282_g1_i1~~c282_g1_i1.p1  ORF type:complete len:347 (-),score=125.54 c282_g1_i1:23-1063(-)